MRAILRRRSGAASVGLRSERRALPWLAHVIAMLGCGEATNLDTERGAASQDARMVAGTSGASGGSGGSAGSAPHTPSPSSGAGSTAHAGASATHAGTGAGGNVAAPSASDGGAGPGSGGAPSTSDGGLPEPAGYPTLEASMIGAPVEIMGGFDLAESPLWDPCEDRLLFTDVTASVIHTLDASGTLGVLMTDTVNANGIAFDVDGSLILAQMGGTGHVARRAPDGTVTQLDPTGSTLHTPDDVIVRSDGTIYFSDGDFYPIGALLGAYSRLPVFSIAPGATELTNQGTVVGPNGIELSPDERTLYVSAYGEGRVWKFDVAEDGALTKGDALIEGLDSNDSLCLDAAGNLYVGVTEAFLVLRPDGTEVTRIPMPLSSKGTSCTFGGPDGKTLYTTTWKTLLKVENMPIPGQDWLVNRERLGCM